MRLETSIRDRAGQIAIEESRFRYEREDGQIAEGEFSIQALDPGVISVLIGGRSYRIEPGAPGALIVNGHPIAIEVFDPRALRTRKLSGASAGRQEISAPMPGKVVRVLVAVGDSVEPGQGLVVVEAMKMQNEMKSPKAGRVVELRARPDAAVQAGETLIVVE